MRDWLALRRGSRATTRLARLQGLCRLKSQACFELLVHERVASKRRRANRLEEVRVDGPFELAAVRRVARSRIASERFIFRMWAEELVLRYAGVAAVARPRIGRRRSH